MPAERRNTDQEILVRLSVLEEVVREDIDSSKKMLEKHDVALYGKDGRNGLITIVSKMKGRWAVVAWVAGAAFVAVIGEAAARLL